MGLLSRHAFEARRGLRRALRFSEFSASKNQFREPFQIDGTFQDRTLKIFFFRFPELYDLRSPIPPPYKEGRFAIVTSVGRGMRWTLRHQLTSDADADGEVVWS
jgi:hypothetical protein